MSDRIDELVYTLQWAANTCPADQNSNSDLRFPPTSGDRIATRSRMSTALTDLATIAREAEARALKAEAMCEWLAGRATMIERELGKQPTWDSSDDWLKAAQDYAERVIHGE